MVTFEEMNTLKWQRPFQPFRVITIDNEVYDVQSPKLILVGSKEVTIGLPHPTDPPPSAGEMVWLWMDSIANVEMIGTHTENS